MSPVNPEVHRFSSYAELASLATEVKNAAKAAEGSSILRDRRVVGEHMDTLLVPLCS